jgi:hypothetical protein
MKQLQITVLALVGMLCGAPAFAQHGHGMGPGGMNPAMGEGGSHRMSPNLSPSTHGVTMTQQLTKNTALAGKIQKLTGMSAQDACSGFKNLGQCVAAAHVSQNLGISFACMKADMTGVAAPTSANCPAIKGAATSTKGIQTLSPTANSKLELKKANKQADQDIKEGSNS